MHAVDMQIHADWKGNVAQDYITLWANCCTYVRIVTEIPFHVFI